MLSDGWSPGIRKEMFLIKRMKTISTSRIDSIDIMRGLTVFLMLFVNDLYEPGVAHWLVHAGTEENSIGLADLVFPAFLFMVGLSLPFAISSRRQKGDDTKRLLQHILIRTISLLIIGVLIFNGEERINPQATGMPKLVWLFLLYVAVFLLWNDYLGFSKNRLGVKRFPFVIVKCAGVLLLLYLVWIFRAGPDQHTTWLKHGWWGILGLIGWGYLAAALAYLFAGRKIIYCVLLWCGALLLNIGSLSGWLDGWRTNWSLGLLDVWLEGNVPAITLAGLVVGMCLKRGVFKPVVFVGALSLIGLFCLSAGFGLRHWFIFSKNIGTPSWAMVCNGLSMLLFAGLYYVVDIRRHAAWARPFRWAGRNALTTYLAPDMVYFLIWYFEWPLFFYKQPIWMGWVVAGSFIWAVLMIFYAQGLTKIRIRLKL